MQQVVRLRGAPRVVHPPYGLYVDPHGTRHAWWAVDARTLLGLSTVLAVLGAALGLVAR